MIARITRILILLQLGIAAVLSLVAIKVWHVESMWLAVLIGIGSVCLLRILITANNFLLARRYHSETPVTRRLNWRQALRLFAGEFKATFLSSSWSMPFHSFANQTIKKGPGLPVLFVHGYSCNSGYWRAMSEVLRHADISHRAVNLEPVLGDIDAYSPAIADAVETLCMDTGSKKVIIVAHSMGGLAARSYLRAYGSRRIAKVITLGTPHRGTGLANSGLGINSWQMRWTGSATTGSSSDWLRELAKAESQETRALFVSIYSHHDNIISPQTSAYMEDAKNIEFHGIGHVALALHPEIQTCVLEEIRLTAQQASTIPAKKSA